MEYRGVMDFEVIRMLFKLTKQPDDAQFLLENMASRIMCTLAWDDPSVSEKNTDDARDLLRAISPCGPLTNILTPLWHLPHWVNPWKQAEKRRHDPLHAWQTERFNAVKLNTQKGTQRPCWSQRFLLEDKSALSGEKEASSCVGMLALMGVLTVGGPLQYFLMSMVHHPAWFKKCQQEVDEACNGKGQLFQTYPSFLYSALVSRKRFGGGQISRQVSGSDNIRLGQSAKTRF